MRIRKEFKPDQVATKDETRSGISAPYLKGGFIHATDGRALAIIPVDLERGETDGHIPSEAFARARAIAWRKRRGFEPLAYAEVTLNKSAAVVKDMEKDQTIVIRRREQATFPQHTEELFPTTKTIDVSFNADLLRNLVDALGSKGPCILRLRAKEDGTVDPHAPIEVTPMYTSPSDRLPPAFGLIMPMRMDDEKTAPAFRDRIGAAVGA